MVSIDYIIVILYFLVVLGMGAWFQKKASKNLESYFLAGKNVHWLPLAMSGSVSTFDITGTMWIVSILFVLGMKSMWHHWMWGVFMAAFFMSYMGKWVRRSNVMTAAEWMETRFGRDRGGKFARVTYALMAVVTLASFIGYAYQGIGKFASVYISLDIFTDLFSSGELSHFIKNYQDDILAIGIISITTFYVILGGLYSVIVTDVFQTIILTLGSIFIAYLAWSKLTPELLSVLPEDWTSLSIPWKIEVNPGAGNAEFEFFGALVIVWILKGLLLNAGGPAQMYDFQRFLAARDSRDAAKIGAAWSGFLVVRWAMTVGIALLALVGITGVTDSEKVMPIVLLEYLPAGIRGLVIAGLLAAFMSTFSSIVNSGAAFIVRDIWQPIIRPNATDKEAVRVSYLASLFVVFCGLAIGFNATSISQIWSWIMMALGAGVVVPNVLRWYWWRLNGWGYSIGTLGGIILSLLALFIPDLPMYVVFPVISILTLIICIIVSLMTTQVNIEILIKFYIAVRPFGLWGKVKKHSGLSETKLNEKSESGYVAIFNVFIAMCAISGLYLSPMFLVGHWYNKSIMWIMISLISIIILKYSWYDNLPLAEPNIISRKESLTSLRQR